MTKPLPTGAQIFEDNAQDYDAWFDTDKGRMLFQIELDCLRSLKEEGQSENHSRNHDAAWLEVGVGSGRFAQALGITHGVEPAAAMASLAQARGIKTCIGLGEQLPYADASFDGVLMVCTICFVQDLVKVLAQCHRVLKPGGQVVIGFVPLDSVWGQHHSARGKSGHTYYAGARFYRAAELIELAQAAGLTLTQTRSVELPAPQTGSRQDAGTGHDSTEADSFCVMRFGKPTETQQNQPTSTRPPEQ
mgnify:CR=1 FL=1